MDLSDLSDLSVLDPLSDLLVCIQWTENGKDDLLQVYREDPTPGCSHGEHGTANVCWLLSIHTYSSHVSRLSCPFWVCLPSSVIQISADCLNLR